MPPGDAESERLVAKAVFGFFPANSAGDDIEVYADESRQTALAVIHSLRQQMAKTSGGPNLALADFVAPKESGLRDYVGMFAVTTGTGVEALAADFESRHDDYNSIMVKALADRLAEALAERLHERVRAEFWAYAPDESLDNKELLRETYQGIRPAPGYPACPDHSEKPALFSLLAAQQNAGIRLTESFAMYPTAAVSGYYIGHPDARYFGTGKFGRDQVEDYARRRGVEPAQVEKWLASNLGYNARR